MPVATVDVHLRRALAFIEEVEKATAAFREQAISHQSAQEDDQPFLSGIASAWKGNRQLQQQKATLQRDLQLAAQEVNQAVALDPEATAPFRGRFLNAVHFRAILTYMHAQLELVWGEAEKAKQLLFQSVQDVEIADAHFMLGVIFEDEHKPVEALRHFEQCLAIEPAGELSVAALREADAMRNYRRRFRGSWILLVVLAVFTLSSFPAIFGRPFPLGLIFFLLMAGALTLYWKRKFK